MSNLFNQFELAPMCSEVIYAYILIFSLGAHFSC